MRCIARAVPALLFLAASATAAHAAQRVYVASTGVDTAPCTLTQPCRSFAAAHASVDAGGEIVALDAAGYGAVSITKSVTIATNPGVFAGIAAATGTAVAINAPDGTVTLRGLQVNGTGAINGIVVSNAQRVVVDNCVISNFTLQGIGASNTELIVANSAVIRSNLGFLTGPGVKATVANSQFVGNIMGFATSSSAKVAVTDTLVTGNSSGFVNGSGAVVSAMRVTVTSNLLDAFVNSGGSVLVGFSHVSHNGGYAFRNDEGFFGSLGNNQLINNAQGVSNGAISATSMH